LTESSPETSSGPADPAAAAVGVPLPSVKGKPDVAETPSRIHLVVVTTRALEAGESASTAATLRTRFWHPRDRQWSENDFESLDHARHLFVDESGWVLRQEQALGTPLAQEWIFEAHRIDFTGSTKEQILRAIGMTPDSVNRLLEQVERNPTDQTLE
jgi:hypothetical protein